MPDVSPLPVGIEPASGESGLGFLLRVARANGLSLMPMLEGLGLPRSVWLDEAAIAVLARATEVDHDWLATAAVIASQREGYRWLRWQGKLWACPLSFRGAHPQICVHCLREGRSCMLEWELAGAVACLRHRSLLSDACGHCGRRLSWARPSVDVCSCGHFLATDAPVATSDAMANWVATLALKGCERQEGFHAPQSALPRWLGPLSADAMLAVGFAFGVREKPFERVASASARVPPSTDRMASILERALVRLQSAHDLSGRCRADIRLYAYEQGVKRLWARNTCTADRDTAAALLQWLGVSPRRPRVFARGQGVDQGELFPLQDGHD